MKPVILNTSTKRFTLKKKKDIIIQLPKIKKRVFKKKPKEEETKTEGEQISYQTK